MNYYSENIINSYIDNVEVDILIDTIDQFYCDTKLLMFYYCRKIIHPAYIRRLIEDRENVKYAYRCMDTAEFRITSVPCLMAYVCEEMPTMDTYYILLICTKHQFKNMGYASSLIQDFVEDIHKKCERKRKRGKIVLSSLDTAATFYEKIGFHWTRKNLSEYSVLLQFEKVEKGKEYIMMEMDCGYSLV